MRSLGWRAALAAGAVLLGAVPPVASAFAPPLTCRDVKTVQGWQLIPIQTFQPIEGVTSSDRVTGYSLAATEPQHVTVTNGKRIKVSSTNGCSWDNGLTLGLQPSGDVPLTGTTSTIVATATLPKGRVVAAVREGTGVASRPHIVASDDGRRGYRAQDSGLPPQGAPRALEAANDGQTLYLVLTPSSGKADDPSGLPTLPDIDSPTSGAKTGLLYGSTDAGRTWELRTSAGDLPGGGGGLDSLAVDRVNPQKIYAVSNGLLLVSTDGGANFSRVRIDAEDVTSVETFAGGFVIAFTKSGRALFSEDGKTALIGMPAPPGVTSAAFRGDLTLAVEQKGTLSFLDLRGTSARGPGFPVLPGSLKSDQGPQTTYHALSGHSLVRYSDKPPPDEETPVAVGDLGVPPPPPGTITPAARTVKLKVGDSTVVDYTLALPKSPTPLDLMFLIDSSTSMDSYIDDLKRNISKITGTLQRAGIDLRVGLATIGTGSKASEDRFTSPSIDSNDPTGEPITLYKLFRKMGPPDQDFGNALARVKTKKQEGTPREAQLAALREATAGLGIRDPRGGALNPLYLVPPGQDAGWRQAPGIRRLILNATDEAFDNPDGSPRKADGSLDFDSVIALMNQRSVKQIGFTVNSFDSVDDLARVAKGTNTLAPPGGADCGQDLVLRAGQPIVCGTAEDFSAVIGRLVRSLSDRQTVGLAAKGTSPKVVRALDATNLRNIDVTVPNTLTFKVAVTCKGQSVGRYTEDVVASLRTVKVASTRLTVDCLGPAAAALLAPPAASAAIPPAPPVVQAPAAVVPAPPVAQPQIQPQSQPQVQTQVNPMTAAALQQQEELQLALALQADEERSQPGEELAMVGHRHRDEGAALVLLAAAMAASAGFGLARLRSRPDPAVVRVRR
jgi:hypothetical protein